MMIENILNKKSISFYTGNLAIFLGALFATGILMSLTAVLQIPERQTLQVKGKEVTLFIQKNVARAPEEFKQSKPIERPMPVFTAKKVSETSSSNSSAPTLNFSAPSFEVNSKLTDGISIGSMALPKSFAIPSIKSDYSLTEVDKKPVPTLQTEPVYPYSAKRQGIEGIVSIRFLVTKEGEVSQLSVVSSKPQGVFEEATEKSVLRWRFSPGMKNGEAVNTWVEMDIEFELDTHRRS